MQTLNQEIREKQFRRVYLLYGEENFLKQSYKAKLRKAILGEDEMNYHYFEGKGLNLAEIISLADTMPFFSEHRLILIESSGLFKGNTDELVEILPDMPESTCMVFVEDEVDKRSRMFKAVKKYGYAAEMVRQSPGQLAKWAAGLLAKEGKKITPRTMEFFLGRVGEDMENIRSELDKLIGYSLGREVITEQDVEAVCTIQVTNQIFEMVGAISGRQTARALKLYEDLLVLREPPMKILFLIARQFNQLLQVREMGEKGMNRSEMASRLKIPPFAVGKLTTQARAFSREQIYSYVQECVDMEQSVKQGRLSDRMAVELLLCRNYS